MQFIIAGKSGLMSRLFVSVDTEEVRELKMLQLEQRIAQHEEAVKRVDEDLKYYILIKYFTHTYSM